MRAPGLVALSVLLFCCESADTFTTGGADTAAQAGMTYRYAFDDSTVGGLPAAFQNVLGDWRVLADATAPSGQQVLRQSGTFQSGDYPRVLVKDLTFSDLRLSLRCRPESGSTDQACGVLFRAKDSDNYYVVRANALEGNVRLYRVVDRNRQQFANGDIAVKSGAWHTLEVRAKGPRITVSFDGAQVIDAVDQTFARGKIGLWLKADSVTAFDDLEALAE